jgi:hypothetical protein
MFEGVEQADPEGGVLAAMEALPLVYMSLGQSQQEDADCKKIRAGLEKGDSTKSRFVLHNKLLCYSPKGSKRRRYVVPRQLQALVIRYYHDSPLAGHLGMFKT